MTYSDHAFWVALLQIIWINILLSGDNAVVIALACRSLPERQRRWGIILGTLPAIVLRIIFAIFIAYLLAVPYLKLAGGFLLFWIAVKMILPEEHDGHGVDGGSAANLWTAVRTIVIADAVMSLDNVIAIAAAAKGSTTLLVIGLAISMPLVIIGSALILKILNRLPILIWAGGALLGYIAGEVMVTDPAVEGAIRGAQWLHSTAPLAGAALAVLVAMTISRIKARREREKLDLIS
ncbi:MAG TPA: TerC family protein [Alphaproteobacteria bacterium]|nr:TerC family protein [Alphaproteobacteria bacterium]